MGSGGGQADCLKAHGGWPQCGVGRPPGHFPVCQGQLLVPSRATATLGEPSFRQSSGGNSQAMSTDEVGTQLDQVRVLAPRQAPSAPWWCLRVGAVAACPDAPPTWRAEEGAALGRTPPSC